MPRPITAQPSISVVIAGEDPEGSGGLPITIPEPLEVEVSNTPNVAVTNTPNVAIPGTVVVQQETYTSVLNGELQGSASALQMPNIACKLVKFKARNDNAGNVYIGKSGVTLPDGTTDTTTGFELDAGEETGWIPVDNLNRFYRICNNAGDDLTYVALV